MKLYCLQLAFVRNDSDLPFLKYLFTSSPEYSKINSINTSIFFLINNYNLNNLKNSFI